MQTFQKGEEVEISCPKWLVSNVRDGVVWVPGIYFEAHTCPDGTIKHAVKCKDLGPGYHPFRDKDIRPKTSPIPGSTLIIVDQSRSLETQHGT